MTRVEMAQAGFEAFNRGDVEAVLGMLSPEIEVHSVAEVGEEGTYHGRDGYLAWTKIWLEAWDEFRIDVDEIEEVDDENVLIHTTQYGRGKGSGVEVSQSSVYLFTVRDELLARLHIYPDRESALEAISA